MTSEPAPVLTGTASSDGSAVTLLARHAHRHVLYTLGRVRNSPKVQRSTVVYQENIPHVQNLHFTGPAEGTLGQALYSFRQSSLSLMNPLSPEVAGFLLFPSQDLCTCSPGDGTGQVTARPPLHHRQQAVEDWLPISVLLRTPSIEGTVLPPMGNDGNYGQPDRLGQGPAYVSKNSSGAERMRIMTSLGTGRWELETHHISMVLPTRCSPNRSPSELLNPCKRIVRKSHCFASY